MDLESFFMTWYVKYYWKFTKVCYILQIFAIYLHLNWKFSILKHVDNI